MSMRRARLVLSLLGVGLALCSWTAGTAAQSLTDAAVKEKARREGLKKPGRTYTEKDLSKPEPPKPAGKGSPSPTSEPPPAEPAYQSEPSRESSEPSGGTEEARWRGQAKDLRAAITRSEEEIKALQSQANLLFTQSLIASDTNEILRLRTELQEAKDKTEAAKGNLEAAKEALAAFEDQARKAGIPPNWWSGPP